MGFEQSVADRIATLGGRLRSVRLARGMTAAELSEKLDISRPTLTTWEQDKVENVSENTLRQFAEITDVPVDWLITGKGKAPKLNFDVPDRAFVGKRRQFTQHYQTPPPSMPQPLPPENIVPAATDVSEITAKMSAHAQGFNKQPHARWSIPREVLTLSFNCEPDAAIIKRIRVAYTAPDGSQVQKGDYVLIDGSRSVIDEPGVYYCADPDAKEARRVIATADETGALVVKPVGGNEPVDPTSLEVLGRAMAVFHGI